MSLTKTERLRRRRQALFKQQDGICHWCPTLCVDPVGAPRHGKPVPKNTATIDHLMDRYHPDRERQRRPGEVRYVMACYGCNTSRGLAGIREAKKNGRSSNRRFRHNADQDSKVSL